MSVRYVFVLFDGTSCELSTSTNVGLIHNIFNDAPKTECIYTPGPDVHSEMPRFQAMFASETTRVAIDAYRRMVGIKVCQTDKVYIIGYSRGAVIARMLAQMITNAELRNKIISKENLNDYVNCDVKFLGLFDPVIGFPYFFPKRAKEYDAVFNIYIKKYIEIISIDETALYLAQHSLASHYKNRSVGDCSNRAEPFSRVKDAGKQRPNQNPIDESRTFIYMPGVHADIGGEKEEADGFIAAHAGLTMNNEIMLTDSNIKSFAKQHELKELKKLTGKSTSIEGSIIGQNRPIWKKMIGFNRLINNNEHCLCHRIVEFFHNKRGKNRNKLFFRLRKYKIRKNLLRAKVYSDDYSSIFS